MKRKLAEVVFEKGVKVSPDFRVFKQGALRIFVEQCQEVETLHGRGILKRELMDQIEAAINKILF